ncbi:4-hydroxybenzoate octaprenyltransferase [Enterococcus diestrammenae]|uniref:4-hydroxybenzoate polyprenyltransferase n=1 Tax=Enterococcus diestrammenae TaxID=1155073 RepID=A0ABV0F437_9ENTE|nr:4-hydroxybenzoate octaprenyltransferase [Enterococcus diestrammenae]KAF1296277.1 4-hydroxybenzoate octaprenyltransferase [Enterococcus diestrammenae]
MVWIKKAADKLHSYGVLVMFQHTIFSFSFGIISLLLASNGTFHWRKIFLLLVGLLAARTGANAINRVIDAEIDRANPRTAVRQIPQGKMSKKEALWFSIACFIVTVIVAGLLGPVTLALSPVAIFFMVIYSYTKRFTALCHLVLGFTCAMAPAGAWIAITNSFSWTAFFLSGANMLWVAGFDIIYGSQDVAFDRSHGIHSIPAAVGVKNGLLIARIFHGMTFICLVMVGLVTPAFGWIYFLGLDVIGALLILEHLVVRPDHLAHAEIASYNVNEIVSLVFLAIGLLDVFF